MALVLKDRVRETSTTTGTGALTLAGAVASFQSFSVIGSGNTTYYTIATTADWEVGIGTYTAPNQLSRDTVIASSNAGALVNLGAGTKDVFVTFPAEGFDAPPAIGGTTPASITGTVISAKTQISLPAVVNTGTTWGILQMVDGGDGYDYLSMWTEDGSGPGYELPIYFPGGLGTGKSFSAHNLISLSQDGIFPGLIELRSPDNSGLTRIFASFTNGLNLEFYLPNNAGSANQVLKTDGSGNLSWSTQGVQGTAPVTVATATHTVAATTQWIIGNNAGTITLTLPAASTSTGRSLNIKTIQAQTVVSASSNVVPIAGGAAGTAILAATAGKYATLVSDGTNWIIMQAN